MQKVCSTDVYKMDEKRYERRRERFATWQSNPLASHKAEADEYPATWDMSVKSPETKKGQDSAPVSPFSLGLTTFAGLFPDEEKAKDYEDFMRMQKASTTEVYEMDEDRYERRRERFAMWQKEQDRRVLRTIGEFCGE